MKQWIRFWGLGIFIAIVLFWFLCIDWIVKTSIETLGTQINGAKVELNSATVNLWPTQITLNGLQVTNPDAPLTNSVAITDINTQLDGLMLMRRQVIIDNASIEGLTFNSPRQSSGAIAADKSTEAESASMFDLSSIDIANSIPGVSLPDTDQLVANSKERMQAKLAAIESELESIKTRWEADIKKLPDEETLDAYSDRWKALKKENLLVKVTGLNKLKDDIQADQKLISNLRKQLKTDQDTIKQQLSAAKAIPSEEADQLLSDVGFSGGSSNFMRAIIGGQAKQWLQQGMTVFNKLSALMGSSEQTEEPVIERGKGQWVHFTEKAALPEFLLRTASISGELLIAGNTSTFSGQAADFAYPPADWTKPATLSIAADEQQQLSFNANATLDHRTQQFNDQLTLAIDNLSINSTRLSDSDEMTLDLQKANSNIDSTIKLSNKQVDIKVNALFDQVELAVDSQSPNNSQKVISSVLEGVKDFDVEILVGGDVNDPTFNLKSNLDKALSAGLKNELTEQTDKLKTKVKQQLEEELADQLAQLQEKSNFLGKMDTLIGDKSNLLEGLTKL